MQNFLLQSVHVRLVFFLESLVRGNRRYGLELWDDLALEALVLEL